MNSRVSTSVCFSCCHHALHIGGAKSQSHVTEDLKLGSGFHTFGIQWTETQYRFFVDGYVTWTATPVSKRPKYIIPRRAAALRVGVRFYEPKPGPEN
jgi:beta-glucanase (GH16 family)